MPKLGEKQPMPQPLDVGALIARSRGTSMREVQDSGMYGKVKGISGATGLATGGSVQEISSAAGTFSIDVPNELLLVGAATAPMTGTGIFLGLDDPDYEFRVGNPAGNYLHWNGSSLLIVGSVTATTGTIGGWTIGSAELSAGNVKLQSTAERILLGSATAPLTGTGIFMGKDGSDYELRVGNPGGAYMHWDGAALYVTQMTINAGNITAAITISQIDSSAIGVSTPSSGAFTTLDTSGVVAHTGSIFSVSHPNGIDINPGSDTDTDLLTLGVTGAPKLSWDESDDRFHLNKGLFITTGLLIVGTQPDYTVTNHTTDRTYDANATSLDELADILGTLIADLQAIGLLV